MTWLEERAAYYSNNPIPAGEYGIRPSDVAANQAAQQAAIDTANAQILQQQLETTRQQAAISTPTPSTIQAAAETYVSPTEPTMPQTVITQHTYVPPTQPATPAWQSVAANPKTAALAEYLFGEMVQTYDKYTGNFAIQNPYQQYSDLQAKIAATPKVETYGQLISVTPPSQQATPTGGTYYAPMGSRTQTELTDIAAVKYTPGGSVGFYQNIYDPNTGKLRNITNLVSSGSAGALQSGMFSEKPLTVDVRTQYTPSKYAPTAMPEYADIVRAQPESFSRLGAEAYGGYVLPLDNRTIESSHAQLSTYPADSGNLASLVSPTAVNTANYKAGEIPWGSEVLQGSPKASMVGAETITTKTQALGVGPAVVTDELFGLQKPFISKATKPTTKVFDASSPQMRGAEAGLQFFGSAIDTLVNIPFSIVGSSFTPFASQNIKTGLGSTERPYGSYSDLSQIAASKIEDITGIDSKKWELMGIAQQTKPYTVSSTFENLAFGITKEAATKPGQVGTDILAGMITGGSSVASKEIFTAASPKIASALGRSPGTELIPKSIKTVVGYGVPTVMVSEGVWSATEGFTLPRTQAEINIGGQITQAAAFSGGYLGGVRGDIAIDFLRNANKRMSTRMNVEEGVLRLGETQLEIGSIKYGKFKVGDYSYLATREPVRVSAGEISKPVMFSGRTISPSIKATPEFMKPLGERGYAPTRAGEMPEPLRKGVPKQTKTYEIRKESTPFELARSDVVERPISYEIAIPEKRPSIVKEATFTQPKTIVFGEAKPTTSIPSGRGTQTLVMETQLKQEPLTLFMREPVNLETISSSKLKPLGGIKSSITLEQRRAKTGSAFSKQRRGTVSRSVGVTYKGIPESWKVFGELPTEIQGPTRASLQTPAPVLGKDILKPTRESIQLPAYSELEQLTPTRSSLQTSAPAIGLAVVSPTRADMAMRAVSQPTAQLPKTGTKQERKTIPAYVEQPKFYTERPTVSKPTPEEPTGRKYVPGPEFVKTPIPEPGTPYKPVPKTPATKKPYVPYEEPPTKPVPEKPVKSIFPKIPGLPGSLGAGAGGSTKGRRARAFVEVLPMGLDISTFTGRAGRASVRRQAKLTSAEKASVKKASRPSQQKSKASESQSMVKYAMNIAKKAMKKRK